MKKLIKLPFTVLIPEKGKRVRIIVEAWHDTRHGKSHRYDILTTSSLIKIDETRLKHER